MSADMSIIDEILDYQTTKLKAGKKPSEVTAIELTSEQEERLKRWCVDNSFTLTEDGQPFLLKEIFHSRQIYGMKF